MKRIAVILSVLVFAIPAFAENNGILEQKINHLNEASIESLGISLNALMFLVDASPNSFLTYDMLDKSERKSIRELENQGYVRTEIITGLPDGQEKNVKFLRILPLKKGDSLRVAMLSATLPDE